MNRSGIGFTGKRPGVWMLGLALLVSFSAPALSVNSDPALFADDFDRAVLGLNWSVENGGYSIAGNQLTEDSGTPYTNSLVRWIGGSTSGPDQFGKFQVASGPDHSWGFMFRVDGTPGDHYQVHLPAGGLQWRWERYDPDFVRRVGDCFGDQPIGAGAWIGATIEGTGADTVVQVWRWDVDPDGGGVVDLVANWGPPDCVMTNDPLLPLDDGTQFGIRSYTGGSTKGAAADNWAGGDIPGSAVCGDGVIEGNEECDDGGETATCDANCTFAACGDGDLNPTAGESCENDADCNAGEICDVDCSCVPGPICGDGFVDPGEDCDDAGESASCDANCTFVDCGDGDLNPTAGESCEADGDCAAGEVCASNCSCIAAPVGQDFCDDFDRGSLGSNWAVDVPSFAVASNQLVENSGATYRDSQMRWIGGTTATTDQYAKLQVVDQQTHSWGFMLRVGGPTGQHYEVSVPAGTGSWRWERYDPGFVRRVGDCVGDAVLSNGDHIGVTVEGAGNGTVVSVWRWDTDPDGGSAVDVAANWGPPDCVMTQDPLLPVDQGSTLGIRSYTGNSSQSGRADDWCGGSLGPPAVCGNGTPESGEECDESVDTPACDADCTFAICGDGYWNDTIEECESDGDCAVDEVCSGGCACEPAPVCGNGSVEAGEECDDAGNSTVCDADCSFAVCGDGYLNDVTEECESSADCAAGEICDAGCGCAPAPLAEDYCDDFNRSSLGGNWTVDVPGFAIASNRLTENSGQLYRDARLRWSGGDTVGADQYGKLQVIDQQTHSWGFMFRLGDSTGQHYEVQLSGGATEWRWERYDPDYVRRVGSCIGDGALSNGDFMGATIKGAGNGTEVSVWRWNGDPDGGGPVDVELNWGPPDCVMTQNPIVAVDDGSTLGIRSYTGNRTQNSLADNWCGGDFRGITSVGSQVTRIIDGSGAGTPGSLIDPDGLALDSAGNVYVASCGVGPTGEGVFKIEPDGTKTQLMGPSGDGVHAFDCGVGIVVDSVDNVYVVGFNSDNVFRITPAGAVTQVIDSSGAGPGMGITGPLGLAVDGFDNVYVSGFFSDNVLKLAPGGGISEILDSSGDGTHSLMSPFGVAADASGNVYVAGFSSDNVFEIPAAGPITQLMDSTGDGVHPLTAPHGIAVDGAGDVYVTGNFSDNVFQISAGPTVTQIADLSGDGVSSMDNPTGIAVDAAGNVYVASFESDNAYRIAPGGTVTRILSAAGDGSHAYRDPADFCVAVGAPGTVYLAGTDADNVFKVVLP